MSEFAEKLNSSELVSKAWDEIDRDQACAGLLIDTISNEFKDWQPPKPLVVVPQFVADWFDINQDDIDGNINALTKNIGRKLKIEWSEMDRWFMHSSNKPIETLICMKLDGYTVEKEKKYILKHVDMSEQYNNTSIYLAHCKNTRIQHEIYLNGTDVSEIKQCHFTQSEIDKLNIGSYEQIEVKVEE